MTKKKYFFLLILLSFFLVFYFWKNKSSPANLKRVKIGRKEILVEVADTPEKREKGLSGRDFLPENQGMLFVFERPDYWGFWMKGMKFPLDFVWIRGEEIVEIEENIQPEDFQPPQVLRPKTPVDKVLEINAGKIRDWEIKKGDKIELK